MFYYNHLLKQASTAFWRKIKSKYKNKQKRKIRAPYFINYNNPPNSLHMSKSCHQKRQAQSCINPIKKIKREKENN